MDSSRASDTTVEKVLFRRILVRSTDRLSQELPDVGADLAPKLLSNRRPRRNPDKECETMDDTASVCRARRPGASRFPGRSSLPGNQASQNDAGTVARH